MRKLLACLSLGFLLLGGCGGGGGGDSTSLSNGSSSGSSGSAAANSVTMTVDTGPAGATGQLNLPYVTVTICAPGTSNCATVDHVLVDTGSNGLRVLSSALGGAVKGALGGQWINSRQVVECAQFADGFTWGPVLLADAKIGGKTASSLPIQVISDNVLDYPIPSGCSSSGSDEGTLSALGAKGIIGVGLDRQDCGSACASSSGNGFYYLCSGQSCLGGAVPLAQQASNPVGWFSSDNNGVLLQLPSVAPYGAASAQGTLTFGIATQSNNAIPAAAKAYPVSADGYTITTIYKGQTYPGFLDSGSNILYFSDNSIATCTLFGASWYCPSLAAGQTLDLSAQLSASNGSSSTVNFSLINATTLTTSSYAAFPSIAAPMTGSFSGYFDWGLPFFYGRSVFIGLAGASNPLGSGAMYIF
ncbi:DUF3443 domain-containing protein [Chromobacterium alticapitis]|uniref:DUF3443 domain-containing protein n=1 Tax=Chromobacterium alticapitis TaxID=2073169 RepID=A0A2S5DEY3_9NEIS|nr:DUF3443 domain-containing protein [Chromobacterium alticapitis]POZ61589.1 hypothetical protein C2I19_13020 [Chromobacterium alticapitis]